MNPVRAGSVRPRLRLLVLRAALVAGFLSIVLTAETAIQQRSIPPERLLRAFIGLLCYWYLWVAASPIVFVATRRFPFAAGQRIRSAAAHIVVAASLMAVLSVVLLAIQQVLQLTDLRGRLIEGGVMVARYRMVMNLLAYSGLVVLTVLTDASAAVRARDLAVAQANGMLAEARLELLRLQLNPHFLFNALNTVSMQVRSGKGDVAVRMLAGLGELLQRVFRAGSQSLVPLHSEIDLLRAYLQIEQARFGDRLQITIGVDDETSAALVPPLLFQPLVENALLHGIERGAGTGSVTIDASRDGDSLQVSIGNSGSAGAEPPAARTGLSNVRDRLHTMFGSDAGLEWRADDRRTVVTVRMPFITTTAAGAPAPL